MEWLRLFLNDLRQVLCCVCIINETWKVEEGGKMHLFSLPFSPFPVHTIHSNKNLGLEHFVSVCVCARQEYAQSRLYFNERARMGGNI